MMAAHPISNRKHRAGQATLEFALAWAAVLVPVTFGILYTALMLWVWHTTANFTRQGARYAATHCWQNGGGNVAQWMRENPPIVWDQGQFVSGSAEIQISYFSRNAESGELEDFSCDGECSPACVPDVVRVAIANYEFRGFFTAFGLSPVTIPNFQTTLPVESAGCDPETATCNP
jgi:hypothetical protein